MPDIDIIRQRWPEERDIYRKLALSIRSELQIACNKIGLNPKISAREKDLTSFIKKAIRKNYRDPYTEVTDKAGVRIVTPFPWQMTKVHDLIYELFEVRDCDNKAHKLELDRIGYQSIHYSVALKGDTVPSDYLEKECEIQLRTLCQDLWSVMSHELAYKSEISIPDSIKRKIVCLGGLLEIADNDFAAISESVQSIPEMYEYRILGVLERHFYAMIGCDYSKELSIDFLIHFGCLLSAKELEGYSHIIDEFVDQSRNELAIIYNSYKDKSAFATQPEYFFILERLDNDPFRLRKEWEKKYPFSELEQLAIAWGKPYDE